MDLANGLGGRKLSLYSTRCWNLLALLLMSGVLLGVPFARGQAGYDTSTLKGTIFDQQGVPVSSATVTVKSAASGLSKTQKVEADGTYQLPALPPGTYQLIVEAPGFSKTVADSVALSVGATIIYDVH